MTGMLLTLLLAAAGMTPAFALEIHSFDIDGADAATAIHQLGEQSGLQVMVGAANVAGRRLNPVKGELSIDEALVRLLSGTGLTHRYVGERSVALMNEETAPQAQAGDGLEEVVVTSKRHFRPESSSAASKLELDVIDTPQALTLLGSEFLSVANLNDTRSVVAYTAGVEASGVGDGTETYLTARGFPVDRYRSFRINGLSVYSEIDVDYYTMDRVEIVRGPASSLYGESDYGATVNRVLKAPTPAFAASLGAQTGSFDLRRIEADVQGSLTESGALSARAVGVLQRSDTFVDATEENHWVLAPSLRYRHGATDVLLQGYYSELDGPTSDGFALIRDAQGEWALPDVPRHRNYAASTNDIDSSNAFAFARVRQEFGETLTGTFSAGLSDVRMFNNSSYLCDCDDVEGDGIADLYHIIENKTQRNTSFDLSLEKRFSLLGRDQRVLVSADWRRNTLDQFYGNSDYLGTYDFVAQGGPYPATLPDLHTGNFIREFSRYYGASLLAYLKPASRLSMLLGLRYSGIKSGLYEYFDGLTQDGGRDDAWVPRVGLVYNLAGRHNLFLSYSEGIIFNATLLDAQRNPVRPEQGRQYEAGIKGELFANQLFYSLSAFTIERSNVAKLFIDPDDPNPDGPPVFVNVGRQRHRGIDLEIQGEPVPGFNVYASYAYLDVRVKESADELEVGNTPGAAPRNSFSLFATYEFLNGPLKALTLGGGYVARGEREIDNYGTFRLPAYDRFDLRASYDFGKRLALELNVVNLFDEKVVTSAYDAPMFGIAYSDVRSVTLGVSYRF